MNHVLLCRVDPLQPSKEETATVRKREMKCNGRESDGDTNVVNQRTGGNLVC